MLNGPPARVSVIIPTKNRSALLREALASVRAVEGPDLDLEVIVADNGSTDDTEEVARECGARFVRTLTPGPAAARNAGLQAAEGEYIAFLDDDDAWLRDHVRPHIELLRARTDLSAVMGQIVPADVWLQRLGRPYPLALPVHGDVFGSLLRTWTQIGALIVRRSVRETVGYFDETLLASEEWDWMLRVALRHRVGFIPQPCLLFRAHPHGRQRDAVNMTRAKINRKVLWRNMRRAGARRPPIWTAVRLSLRYDGKYVDLFLRSAAGYLESGDAEGARSAFGLALRTSPLHIAWGLVRSAGTRRIFQAAARRTVLPRSGGEEGDPALGPDGHSPANPRV